MDVVPDYTQKSMCIQRLAHLPDLREGSLCGIWWLMGIHRWSKCANSVSGIETTNVTSVLHHPLTPRLCDHFRGYAERSWEPEVWKGQSITMSPGQDKADVLMNSAAMVACRRSSQTSQWSVTERGGVCKSPPLTEEPLAPASGEEIISFFSGCGPSWVHQVPVGDYISMKIRAMQIRFTRLVFQKEDISWNGWWCGGWVWKEFTRREWNKYDQNTWY